MRQEIFQTIIEKLASMYPVEKAYRLGGDDNLQEADIDSLVFIQLLAYLENTYNITFDDEMLDPEILSTINAIIDCIEAKLGR